MHADDSPLGDSVLAESLGRFLRAAIASADALAKLHQSGIIHQNVRPQNLRIDLRTAEVQVSGAEQGFEPSPSAFKLPIDSLPYISPEQTGRLDASIDHRTDLYSLGVMLYELLAGVLPFQADDALGWVHCHIARAPRPLVDVVRGVPAVVGGILARLLAKAPDERYQSARGLQHDLERCLAELEDTGEIAPFPLGARDIWDKLRAPSAMVGRKEEIAALQGGLGRVTATGAPEVMLVAGPSGIGKSSLLRDLRKGVGIEQAIFLSASFEPNKQDIPYALVAQAFGALIRQTMTLSDAEMAVVAEQLRAVLGTRGQVIADFIPQLELIIGKQPPLDALTPAESRNRFNAVFHDFVSIFASKGRPVVLLIDDLQWADLGSLDLLQHLLTHPKAADLLVVGNYRDGEVDDTHPLAATLKAVRDAKIPITSLTLAPLDPVEIVDFLVDMFAGERAQVEQLATLLWSKTEGNPFLLTQVLGALHQEHLIHFDLKTWSWHWNVEQIEGREITDERVDLVMTKITRLPTDTEDALRRAACIGREFTLQLLGTLCGKTPEEVRQALQPALAAGLLLQRPQGYRFLHDRVQQVTYSLIPEEERAAVHLDLGRHLLASTPPEEVEGSLFEIVNQLNLGASRIISAEERRLVAALDARAGHKAKTATAPRMATTYLTTGLSLLPEEGWEVDPPLAFRLHRELAECEYLNGRSAEADRLTEVLLQRARTNIERAAACRLYIALSTARMENQLALEKGVECLRSLGIELSLTPGEDDIFAEVEAIRAALAGRAIKDLLHLPAMEDPEVIAIMEILSSLYAAAVYVHPPLAHVVITRMVRLSIQHGNTAASSHGYVTYGQALCGRFGAYREGYEFGKLACDLAVKPGFGGFVSEVMGLFGASILVWTRHVGEALDYFRLGFQSGRELGNLLYASSNLLQYVMLSFYKGDPLATVLEGTVPAIQFANQANLAYVSEMVLGIQRVIYALRGATASVASLSGDGFDEAAFHAHLEGAQVPLARYWYYVYVVQARYLGGDYPGAHAMAKLAESLRWATLAGVHDADHHLFAVLSATALLGDASEEARAEYQASLAMHEEKLRGVAALSAENFESKHALVAAEIARVEGRDHDAARLYDKAIRAARASSFVQDEALACELAARFYLSREFAVMPSAYMMEARKAYERWGATGKVRQLEALYPQLLERPRGSAPVASDDAEPIDTLAAVRASAAISSEIAPDQLLATLMRILVEHAGAQRCCLLLPSQAGLTLAAETTLDHAGVRVHLPTSRSTPSAVTLPLSVAYYVQRTREKLVLDDIQVQLMFADDPYLSRSLPRSMLCTPILRRGEVAGILYLENRLVRGAFTPRRLALLEFLAAVSLENALLAADLAKESAERTHVEQTLRESEERLQRLVETANVVPWEVNTATGRFTYVGPQAVVMLGYPQERWYEEGFLREHAAPGDFERARAHLQDPRGGLDFDLRLVAADGRTVWLHNVVSAPRSDGSGVVGGFLFDVTERKAYEADLQEKLEIIEAQQASIRKLSTPIIAVWKGVLTMPVLGSLDAQRAEQMMEVVLEEVTRTGCRHMIIDLTGVEAVDTGTAYHLMKISDAIQLLGARSVVVGIRPEVAQTIVALGVDLSSVVTLANLREALLECMRLEREAAGRTRAFRARGGAARRVP
ncbi:AAA family ATPase [Chondromyces apiculatus]|uniref:RsbR, positive regulator of sigma-B n=1 Tax=Chondromyces apiculatus DSM 436 TaxID=1192034 RepID=A0A017TI02_9BACT|nr:AAA family ATPase [Chondromyces apiculatus]EYF08908.1 RsbR, positive regulator of sigma-B [Chondromyces apiculatus DSM 436]